MNFDVWTVICCGWWSLWVTDLFPSRIDDAGWVWACYPNQLVAVDDLHWALICISYTWVASLFALVSFESGSMMWCSVSWDSMVIPVFHFLESVEVIQAIFVEVIISHFSWILAYHLVTMTLIFEQRNLRMRRVFAAVVHIWLKVVPLWAISTLTSWRCGWALPVDDCVDGGQDATSLGVPIMLLLASLKLSLIGAICHHIGNLHRRIRSMISSTRREIFPDISTACPQRCASRSTESCVHPNSRSLGKATVDYGYLWITFACARSSSLTAVDGGDTSKIFLALVDLVKEWVIAVSLVVARRLSCLLLMWLFWLVSTMEDVALVALSRQLATLGRLMGLMARKSPIWHRWWMLLLVIWMDMIQTIRHLPILLLKASLILLTKPYLPISCQLTNTLVPTPRLMMPSLGWTTDSSWIEWWVRLDVQRKVLRRLGLLSDVRVVFWWKNSVIREELSLVCGISVLWSEYGCMLYICCCCVWVQIFWCFCGFSIVYITGCMTVVDPPLRRQLRRKLVAWAAFIAENSRQGTGHISLIKPVLLELNIEVISCILLFVLHICADACAEFAFSNRLRSSLCVSGPWSCSTPWSLAQWMWTDIIAKRWRIWLQTIFVSNSGSLCIILHIIGLADLAIQSIYWFHIRRLNRLLVRIRSIHQVPTLNIGSIHLFRGSALLCLLQWAHGKTLHYSAEIFHVVELLAQHILIIFSIVWIDVPSVAQRCISGVILSMNLLSGVIFKGSSCSIMQKSPMMLTQCWVGVAGVPLMSSCPFVF